MATDRQSRKAATRERVIAAARELFIRQGYEETTVREIARHARVSVGSVFTSFATKAEILSQAMMERLDGLYGELDQLAPRLRGSTADRLRSMFAIHYAFETRNTRLFLAHIAAAFDGTLGAEARPFGRNPRLRQNLRDCLAEGRGRDVDPEVDLEVVVDGLMASYA